jgi:2-oxoisovalerate dehydrogenase E2 component (dihydrolipoyl transacylase)
MSATYRFKLPDIGEGIAEAEIVAWHADVGDVVEEDAPLADLMTDKATVEMTSPVSGRITELAGAVGDQVAIGSILAVFETEGQGQAEGGVTPPAAKAEHPAEEQPPVEKPEPPLDAAAVEVTEIEQPAGKPGKILASPAVRQRARNLGIDLAEVRTAEPGRIRHADLDAFLSYNASGGYRAAAEHRADQQVKVIGLRRRIAENMAASKRHIPHFTYVEEIDVTKLEALRADLNDTRGSKPRLTLLPLLITAVCRSLPDFPMLNARYDDEAGIVTRHGAVHLGLATQTDAGLMVPVIRNAESRNIWQLAAEILRLADAARSGRAKPEELSGSTLTVTSLGPLGGIATTPVINRPEVAILGPNKVVERPVFRDGELVAAKLMNLSISCDHRVVDGWDAASFVQALRKLLETPALLFAPLDA